MKQSDIEKVMNDDNWIRIDFRTLYSIGSIIIKQSLYKIKIKQIEKKLKGLSYWIDYNYQLKDEDKQILEKGGRI